MILPDEIPINYEEQQSLITPILKILVWGIRHLRNIR